jgi:hypothetical protein
MQSPLDLMGYILKLRGKWLLKKVAVHGLEPCGDTLLGARLDLGPELVIPPGMRNDEKLSALPVCDSLIEHGLPPILLSSELTEGTAFTGGRSRLADHLF